MDRKTVIWYAGLLGLFLLEFFIFRTYIFRELVDYYPVGYDQSTYLSESYKAYEVVLKNGLRNIFSPEFSWATSILFIPQAVVFFLIFGASRVSALYINFIYFVALQLVLTYVVQYVTGRRSWAVLTLGLLLAIATPFFGVGGLTDFRIDFDTLCLYGIFVSLIIRSDLFLSRKWTIVIGMVTIFLVLLRCLTVAYVVPILGLMFLFYVTKMKLCKQQPLERHEQYKQRIKNLLLLACIVGSVVAVFLWLNRTAMYNYYIVGHLIGEERYIRLREAGIFNAWDYIRYYPNSFLKDHLGSSAVYLMTFLLLVMSVVRVRNRSEVSHVVLPRSSSGLREIAFFLGLCILIPATILTIDVSKSPIAIGIVMVPFIWLVLCTLLFLGKTKLGKNSIFLWTLASISFAYGMACYVSSFVKHDAGLFYQDKVLNITKMNQDIGNYIQTAHWQNPLFASDQILVYTNSAVISLQTYEKTRIWHNITMSRLGGNIFSIKEPEAIEALKKSSIFVLNLADYSPSPYPFDQDMKKIRPKLRALAEKQFIRLGDYSFHNSTYRVYVRPDFTVEGLSGDWITEQGIVINIPNQVAQRATEIVLSGQSNFTWISPKTKVFATFKNAAGQTTSLEVKMRVSGDNYIIQCRVPSNWFGDTLKIQMTFSDYFIPKKLGINADERKLVIMQPTEKRVILQRETIH